MQEKAHQQKVTHASEVWSKILVFVENPLISLFTCFHSFQLFCAFCLEIATKLRKTFWHLWQVFSGSTIIHRWSGLLLQRREPLGVGQNVTSRIGFFWPIGSRSFCQVTRDQLRLETSWSLTLLIFPKVQCYFLQTLCTEMQNTAVLGLGECSKKQCFAFLWKPKIV